MVIGGVVYTRAQEEVWFLVVFVIIIIMAAINRARASLTSTHHANTATTSNPRPTGSTPYLTSHSAVTSQQGVLAAIRGLSKKQDDMFEKHLDLERKVLTFMQDSFDITKMSYYVIPLYM